MKNIFKLLFVSILITAVLIACDNEADRDWTTPEASFKLNDTSMGAENVLYKTMENNPFILVWESIGAGEYSVVLSSTEDFANKVELGKSSESTFTTTIGTLNTKLLQAGFSPFVSQMVYIRVEKGGEMSNAISFNVKAYPVNGPVITAPTNGSTVMLNSADQSTIATTVTWSDYATYGSDVVYKVEIAKKGTTTFLNLGEVTNTKSLAITSKDLNTAALNSGGIANQESEFDLRVTAKTSFSVPSIELQSAISTIKITPFKVEFVNLYLVGDATAAGWNNSATNADMYPLLGNKTVSASYTYTGFFKAGGFKLIKVKGSWDAQYGAGSSAGTLSSDGGSGNITVAADGYYKLAVNIATMTYTLEAITPPSTTYPTIGIIGDATPNAWDASTAMTQSTFDPHIWYITNVNLTNGKLKFRANNAWDVNWGSSDEDFGIGTQGGPDINVKAGTYNIYFNDATGAFSMIKL
ncbi:SusF/SusE family outer membrane protein [Epilithonimonas arachidiradicis]|uniref:SusE-like outer membrane protein n=1 Tax=Epilithonimonas arachidiradicis TaxID=1617282 RepID=A0A420CMX5_9FLAO|nr:SusF/SusE family outer membrane protein [Epilithonimonas arachidiradicis]RKE79753.1 SusE-like outer membrane protein [Epilithonimonas arachidiradicis]GGG52053.1 hypothetical protein GCM10007332_12130 [Epilithonimonas arachidiradicis]